MLVYKYYRQLSSKIIPRYIEYVPHTTAVVRFLPLNKTCVLTCFHPGGRHPLSSILARSPGGDENDNETDRERSRKKASIDLIGFPFFCRNFAGDFLAIQTWARSVAELSTPHLHYAPDKIFPQRCRGCLPCVDCGWEH